jgi:hypothetical protein
MSRTNPYKKKRRRVNKTLLVFGEGLGEEMFLKHLKKLYSFNNGIAITIKKGKGGSARNIVVDASKTSGDFDKKIVVLDNDKPKKEMLEARREAKKRKIKLIENTPCLEFILLSVFNKEPKEKLSLYYKHKFESKYIKKKKRTNLKEYDKIFPKKILDSGRLKIPSLHKLILIMEA